MPTYEYRCPKGHEFELVQRMSDEPKAPCPECEEIAERLLSGGAGLIFKGEGFYITDHRSDEYKKAASSDKEAASGKVASGSSGDSGGGESSGGAGASDGSGGGSDGGSSESKSASPEAPAASDASKSSDVGKSSSSDA